MNENIRHIICGLVVSLIITPLIAMFAWNNIIAYEFNLPTFDFWAFVLIRFAYKMWFDGVHKIEKNS